MTVGPFLFPVGGFEVPQRMATHYRIRALIGLAVILASVGAARPNPADADEGRDSSGAAAREAPLLERYLLHTDGRLIKGIVTEEGTIYRVSQLVGTMQFPKRAVEGVFDTVRDAYTYRVQQLPERDADERLKLARWCLNLGLKNEAREQLKAVTAVNNNHSQARAMLFSMEQSAALIAQRGRDSEVKQASAQSMVENRPSPLDSAVIEGAQRKLNIAGMPVIFDLPTPLAIKRTQEFKNFINPILQAYCVRCHDGHYDGEFQLVPMKGRADHTVDGYRANLDATLRLVDPESPAKSELLTSTLRAHGPGPRPRPIFPGSNDRTYQIPRDMGPQSA